MPRRRLLEQLAAHSDHPLLLVSAPAGYGKTTLVADWLATQPLPNAWLSLDEYDNDLTIFLAYLAAAIRGLFPDSCIETTALLRAVTLPAVPVVAATLINDLQQIDERFIMVLDDYHAIRDPAIHQLIERLLHHPPAHLQLVIITRRDPLLPLSRYRAQAQMAEIRTQQLRFTREEVAALLGQMLDAAPATLPVERLETQTEGWITGLRLAILSSVHEEQPVDGQLEDCADSRYAMEYLMAEVFAQQTPRVRDFLLKTAILDRLSAPLCEAVVDGSAYSGEAQEILDSAWDANLFIVALDSRNTWFRYHQLLRQFLQDHARRQLSVEDIRALHLRAARWFAQAAYLEEAARHFLHAGDEGRAIRLLLSHRHELMKQGNWSGLRRLLELLPRPVIDREPALLIQEAWLQRIQWRAAMMQSKLEAADALLLSESVDESTRRALSAESDTLHATVSLQSGAARDAIDRLTRALESMDDEYDYLRGYARMLLANALQMNGDKDAAVALLSNALHTSLGNAQLQLRAWSALALIYYLEADLDGLWLAGTRCNEISSERGEVDGMLWGQYRLGVVHYLRNDLRAAEKSFAVCSDRPRPVHTMTTTNTAIGRALVYQALGKTEQAREIAEENVTILEEMDHATLVPMAKAFRAELAARQGRMAEACAWIPQAGAISLQQEYVGFYAPQLALPKIRLLEHDRTARQHAAAYLAKLRAALEVRHNRRFRIEVLALQAVLHEQEGDRDRADALLEEAVALAAPGRLLRPFADIGANLKPVMARIAGRAHHSDFSVAVLALLDPPAEDSITDDVQATGADTATSAPTIVPTPSIALLTNREIDVLLLLARRMTNKEIAQTLGISAETVKRHASNLFQKLDAGNRRQAVAKARAMGLLSYVRTADSH